MSPSILFDNILITDSISVAEDYAAKSYDLKKRKIDEESVSTASSDKTDVKLFLLVV